MFWDARTILGGLACQPCWRREVVNAMDKSDESFMGNLRFMVIVLVVVGNVINRHAYYTISDGLYAFRTFIWLFHLPLLLFLCGIEAKDRCADRVGLSLNDVIYYLCLYFGFYYFVYSIRSTYTSPAWNPFSTSLAPWLLLVLCFLGASTAFVARIRLGARLVLPIAVALSCISGFYEEFGEFLCLAMVANYAPFYYAGFFLGSEGFVGFLDRIRSRRWAVVAAAFALACACAAMFLLPGDIVKTLYQLSLCHKAYADCGSFSRAVTFGFRAIWYVAACVLGLSVSLLVPHRTLPVTTMGDRVLQVYVLHTVITTMMAGFGIFRAFADLSLPYSGVLLTLFGVLLATVLAIPSFPTEMFRMLRDRISIADD